MLVLPARMYSPLLKTLCKFHPQILLNNRYPYKMGVCNFTWRNWGNLKSRGSDSRMTTVPIKCNASNKRQLL